MLRALPRVDAQGEYLPWDRFRHHRPPAGLTVRQWWTATRLQRRSSARVIPLRMDGGAEFTYNLPDEILRLSDDIARRAAGAVGTAEAVMSRGDRDRYLVNSLMDEAISSSQLEGASTSRIVARRMLEAGRAPRDTGERMIVNNFRAMSMLRERLAEPVSPGLILDIHAAVSEGALEFPEDAGRLQRSGDVRVRIYGDGDQVLHTPPPAGELPARMDALCAFLNASEPWMPPVLKALTAHFMMGYDHYFADGNGRTARALFYWIMLREGFWLTEYVVVSQLLTKGPAKYARSFLLAEQDEGDLTHFFLFHLRIIERALDRLDTYLAEQVGRTRLIRARLRDRGDINLRQASVLEALLDEPDRLFDVQVLARMHRVSAEAARQDLHGLERAGFLVRGKRGRRHVWSGAQGWQQLVAEA